MVLAAQSRRLIPLPRGAAGSFALVGLMILVGYVGITYLFQRVSPSPEQVFDRLAAEPFEQPLPQGLRVVGGSAKGKVDGGGYRSFVLDAPGDPETFEGSEVLISYQVFPTLEESRAEFVKAERELLVRETSSPPGFRPRVTYSIMSLPLAEENWCVVLNDRTDYCLIKVGPVWIDVTSRLELGGLGEDPYPGLAKAALAHLRAAVPGID